MTFINSNAPKPPKYPHREKRPHIPKQVRQEVVSMFGGRCAYCGEKKDKLQIDHKWPVARGGYIGNVNGKENLFPACGQCNNFKMSFDIEGFRRELSYQVERGLKNSINFRNAAKFGQIQITQSPIVFYFEKISLTPTGDKENG